MPDDHHPLMPRRQPEDIDLGAIKTDLEFLIEWVSRGLPEGGASVISHGACESISLGRPWPL